MVLKREEKKVRQECQTYLTIESNYSGFIMVKKKVKLIAGNSQKHKNSTDQRNNLPLSV